MATLRILLASAIVLLGLSGAVYGQKLVLPEVVYDQSKETLRQVERSRSDRLAKLIEIGNVLEEEELVELMKEPVFRSFKMAKKSEVELSPEEIAAFAHENHYEVGWARKCGNCPHWHFQLAGGYAVSEDGVIATCAHVVDPEKDSGDESPRKKGKEEKTKEAPEQKEEEPPKKPKEEKAKQEPLPATLVVIDPAGEVHPVTSILAYNARMDAALIQIDSETVPLPLNQEVAQGEPAFCLSKPIGRGDYFSAGVVNRFYWKEKPKAKPLSSLKNLEALRLNVSSRWAPGSSGSPVFDRCGNVMGHVASITARSSEDGAASPITFHHAIPSVSVLALKVAVGK